MCIKGYESTVTIRNNIKSVIDTYENNYTRIGELDLLQEDLLHEIEWSCCNVVDGFKLYKELQEVRRERRDRKNENDSLKPLYDLLEPKKKMLEQLNQCIGECRKNDEAISRRSYIPRIKTEIKEKVNIVMRNVVNI